MPEFILNKGTRAALFAGLDDFERGYIEAMFFTNGDTGDDDENSLNRLGLERLTREALKRIKADCRAFTGRIQADGCFVRQWLNRCGDYDDAQAGRDFWFTRQGHGCGYWDRGLGETGDGLSNAARACGEAQVYTNNGWIYYT